MSEPDDVTSPEAKPERQGVYDLSRLRMPQALGAVGAIGAVLLCVAGAFAYTGGWLSPDRLTPSRIVDQFETNNGAHPGFRRNHSKGVCFTGWFDSDGSGSRLSKAKVFAAGRTPIFGRFAIANGQPAMPDTPAAVHSMAVNFTLPNGELWRTGMNGIPVFPVGNVRDFYDQLVASRPDPATGKPDPARMSAFMASHPASARAVGLIKGQPLASAFANTSYNSLDAFLFVDKSGRRTPVRWSMVAEDAFAAAKPDPTQKQDPNYQFDDLARRLGNGPIRWQMIATIGRPGDPTDDPSIPWPAGRETVRLGMLTIDRLQDEAHGACRDVTFDPLILPDGIAPSDDPILSARSAAYAQSFRRRAGEPAPVSAVRLPAGAGGAR